MKILAFTMTTTTTPTTADTSYYFAGDTTQTVQASEYEHGGSSSQSIPSQLQPLSPRPSRSRAPSPERSYQPSEPYYDPNSAMSVFSAWGSIFSDEPGAGQESNWFHDQRTQSVWGGNTSQHGNGAQSTVGAPDGNTTVPDFLSELASVFSAPAGTEQGSNWFHDQRVHSQWSNASQDSGTSYVSAQTSSVASSISSLSSLSEAASQAASRATRSNAGSGSSISIASSHHTRSVSSVHTLSEAGSERGSVARSQSARLSSVAERQNRLPSVSSGGYNASLNGSELGAIAAARHAGRFRADSIADSGRSARSYSARSMTDSERQAVNSAFGTGRFGRAQGSTTATLVPDRGGFGSEDARRAAKGKSVATGATSTASTDGEWIAASKIVFSDGDGGRLPPDYHVYPLYTNSRASGLPPERPAPPPPRR